MTFSLPAPANPVVAMQHCGYARFRDPRTGQESFTRRLGGGFYPRFHVYLKESPDQLVINLHLDQKQPTYLRGHAHSGEYDGELVENEARRIQTAIKQQA